MRLRSYILLALCFTRILCSSRECRADAQSMGSQIGFYGSFLESPPRNWCEESTTGIKAIVSDQLQVKKTVDKIKRSFRKRKSDKDLTLLHGPLPRLCARAVKHVRRGCAEQAEYPWA